MKILTVNSGSTSIKFKLFDMPAEIVLAHGKVENIGQKEPKLSFYSNGYIEEEKTYEIFDHEIGLQLLIEKRELWKLTILTPTTYRRLSICQRSK